MFVILSMLMVIFNDFVKQFGECSVRIMTSSVEANSRVSVLCSRKNHGFEWYPSFILGILVLIEDFWCKVFAKKRFACSRELDGTSEHINTLELRSSHDYSSSSSHLHLDFHHFFDSTIHVLNKVFL